MELEDKKILIQEEIICKKAYMVRLKQEHQQRTAEHKRTIEEVGKKIQKLQVELANLNQNEEDWEVNDIQVDRWIEEEIEKD